MENPNEARYVETKEKQEAAVLVEKLKDACYYWTKSVVGDKERIIDVFLSKEELSNEKLL